MLEQIEAWWEEKTEEVRHIIRIAGVAIAGLIGTAIVYLEELAAMIGGAQ